MTPADFGPTVLPIRDTLLDIHAWLWNTTPTPAQYDERRWATRRFNQLDDLAHLSEPAFTFFSGDCSL